MCAFTLLWMGTGRLSTASLATTNNNNRLNSKSIKYWMLWRVATFQSTLRSDRVPELKTAGLQSAGTGSSCGNGMWGEGEGGIWLTALVPFRCWIFQKTFQPLTVIQRQPVVRDVDTGNTKNASVETLISRVSQWTINEHFCKKYQQPWSLWCSSL